MNKNHIMFKLFKSFEENNIRYLHFKSNTNLSKSFENKADYDVLVDKDRIDDVERLIIKNNGKRHNPIHIGGYPGVDNWLVFDELSGNIYHLHLHYQLATGKPLVKDYIIPWNELLFSTRKKDPEFDIYITDPNVELLLLSVRMVLKAHSFDYLKKILGLYEVDNGMQMEWNDLANKVSSSEIKKVIEEVFPDQVSKITETLSRKELSRRDYLWLHKYYRHAMSNHRRYSSFEAFSRSVIYRIVAKLRRIWANKFGGLPITKKTSLQGGLIIAFVGVDGAGKSTLSNEIAKWISVGKIECKRFYMGTGDGKTTHFVSFIKQLKKIKEAIGNRPRPNTKNGDNLISEKNRLISLYKNPVRYCKEYINIMQINSVQKNNSKKIRDMYRYKLNGGISVLDRWPQLEIAGQNDGPKIVKYEQILGSKRFLKKRIKKEMQNLGIVKVIKPDIIFRLNISIDTCMRRKEENIDRSAFECKLKELNQLTFQGAKIVEINAELPYNEELLLIKRMLWKYI